MFDGPLCNNICWRVFIPGKVRSVTRYFTAVSHIVHGSALPIEKLMHSRESVSRPADGKVWSWLVEISRHDILLSPPSAVFFNIFTGNLKWEEWLYERGSIYLWKTYSLSHAVGIGVSFIGCNVAGSWISRVVFSAEAKRLKLCHLYVSILRCTEKITLSFNSLSDCEVILLETQEILEDLLRNYHCRWILCELRLRSQCAREGQCKSQISYGVCQHNRRKVHCIIRRPHSFLSGLQIRFNSNVKKTLHFKRKQYPLGLGHFVWIRCFIWTQGVPRFVSVRKGAGESCVHTLTIY
jgi:hypothetical protein